MSKESKARELWIDGFKFGPDESVNQTVCVSTIPNMYKLPKQKRIHVIEYSAYEKALKMCEELAGALDKCLSNGDIVNGSFKLYIPETHIARIDTQKILTRYNQWKEGMK